MAKKTTKAVQSMLRTIGKPITTPVTIGGRQPSKPRSEPANIQHIGTTKSRPISGPKVTGKSVGPKGAGYYQT